MDTAVLVLFAESALIVAVALAAAWYICNQFSKFSNNLELADKHTEEVYAAAQKLINDPTVPDSIIRFVGLVYGHLGKSKVAWLFTLTVLLVKMERAVKSPPKESKNEFAKTFARDFRALTPKQMEHFTKFICGAFLINAYCDGFFTSFHLRVWGTPKRLAEQGKQPDIEKMKSVATKLDQCFEVHHHGHTDSLVAA